MTTSKKLLLIKKLTGLTQEKLAQKLDVSFVTLNSWINDRSHPHQKKLERIDELYKRYTGQSVIPDDILTAKKKLIVGRVMSHKNILKLLCERHDIHDQFMLSLTYNSNSIEGSTLSINETAAILFENRSIPKKTLIEQLEAKNHQTAFEFLINHLTNKGKMDEGLILKLHSILMNSLQDDAGFYRRHSVRIVGSNVPTSNYLKVPDLMAQLSMECEGADIVKEISEFHADFEKIHPFSDGNGRIGRLLMTGMLLRQNLPPAIILQSKKQLYYTFLKKAQLEGDLSLLQDFICDAILEGFDLLK